MKKTSLDFLLRFVESSLSRTGGLGPGGLDMKGIPEMKGWVLLAMVPRFEGPKPL